jgi:membrane-associated phospholipid phosphatase
MIFGFDPTVELYKIANPYLTELLQIAYASFFFLPIILAVHLLSRNRIKEFHFAVFAVVYGFLLSYIGYFILPAIGPRFTLHDFHATNTELPGLFLTNFLRDMVNAGESIRHGVANPEEIVQRDVFPSGHTQMTLIVMYLSFKFKLKSKYFFLVVGTLLIFATMYLRYHYFIDLVAGALFMIFTMWSGYYLYNWWMRKTGREEFSYHENNKPS